MTPQDQGTTIDTGADPGANAPTGADTAPPGGAAPEAPQAADPGTGGPQSGDAAHADADAPAAQRRTMRQVVSQAAAEHERRLAAGDRTAAPAHGFLTGLEGKLNEIAHWVRDHGRDDAGKHLEFEGDAGEVVRYLREMF